jgi:hypothetical protein
MVWHKAAKEVRSISEALLNTSANTTNDGNKITPQPLHEPWSYPGGHTFPPLKPRCTAFYLHHHEFKQ